MKGGYSGPNVASCIVQSYCRRGLVLAIVFHLVHCSGSRTNRGTQPSIETNLHGYMMSELLQIFGVEIHYNEPI